MQTQSVMSGTPRASAKAPPLKTAPADDDPLLSPLEASKICGTSAETIRRWIRKGVVPVVHVGPYRRPKIRRSIVLRDLRFG